MSDNSKMTKGEKMVYTNNVCDYSPAQDMKVATAALIDRIEGQKLPNLEKLDNRRRHDLIRMSQTRFAEACDLAIKAMYTEDEK